MPTKKLILALILLSVPLLKAQNTEKPSATAQDQSFLLTLTLKASDHGKATVDQTYTLAASATEPSTLAGSTGGAFAKSGPSLRDGDKIPITTSSNGDKTEIQYIDIGTNIDFRDLRLNGSLVGMTINVENSSVVPDKNSTGDPIIRNTRYSISPSVPIGKQVTIYSSSDPSTGHKVEIQLLVQPLSAK